MVLQVICFCGFEGSHQLKLHSVSIYVDKYHTEMHTSRPCFSKISVDKSSSRFPWHLAAESTLRKSLPKNSSCVCLALMSFHILWNQHRTVSVFGALLYGTPLKTMSKSLPPATAPSSVNWSLLSSFSSAAAFDPYNYSSAIGGHGHGISRDHLLHMLDEALRITHDLNDIIGSGHQETIPTRNAPQHQRPRQ